MEELLGFADFHPGLQQLLRRHGPEKVWDAGMRALGYPVGLIHTMHECLLVTEELEK